MDYIVPVAVRNPWTENLIHSFLKWKWCYPLIWTQFEEFNLHPFNHQANSAPFMTKNDKGDFIYIPIVFEERNKY